MMSHDEITYVLRNIPARQLTCSCRQLLSQMLNPEQPLLTSSHLARDCRGLAELMGFSYNEIRNFQRATDPTAKMLDAWEVKGGTLSQLVQMFERMERYDVIDEALPLLNSIATNYQAKQIEPPLQVAEVTGSSFPSPESCVSSNPDIMTVEDIQNKNELCEGMSRYDAYVLYADEDLDFVRELADRLEHQDVEPRPLKLYIRERDSLVGVIECDAMARLIIERCNFVLIIFSPEFVQSPQGEFQTKFVGALAMEQRKRKLIPVIYKPCTIPPVILCLTKLDFTKPGIKDWAWRRLVASLSSGNPTFLPQNGMMPLQTPIYPPLPPPPSLQISQPSTSMEVERRPQQQKNKFLQKFKFPSSSSASSGYSSQTYSYEKMAP